MAERHRHHIAINALTRLVALAIFFAAGTWAESQNHCGTLSLLVRKKQGEVWTFRFDGQLGQESSTTRSNIFKCGAGAGFSLSREATIAVYTQMAHAEYLHIDNKDSEISVSESISWRRASGFFFGFYFEQRRLFYKPSNYAKNLSSCGGIIGWQKSWDEIGLSGKAACQVICNMKSLNTKADVVQRIKLPLSIKKSITGSLAICVSYEYGFLGENQMFIGDRDRMNSISASLEISL